jgi:aminoglycoside 6'-N-acetyltransferase I
MLIIDLNVTDLHRIEQLATLLMDGFSDTGSDAWQTRDEALLSVRESLQLERISRVALDDSARAIGWIGGRSTYRGRVWELHPLVVRRDSRGQGIGRGLVNDFEAQVKVRGGSTIYLGTDDENGRTSLGGIDLYPDPLAAAAQIRNLGRHPFEFYRKVGFSIVGVLPDANGFGKPDIFMAKRVRYGTEGTEGTETRDQHSATEQRRKT